MTNDLPAKLSPLGERVQLFKPMTGNLVAGYLLALIFVGGGIALLGWVGYEIYLYGGQMQWGGQSAMTWRKAGVLALIALLPISFGVIILLYVRWLARQHIELCEFGFRRKTNQGMVEVMWQDVAVIRETTLYERPPLLRFPASLLLPKVASMIYTIVTDDGQEYAFNGNSVEDLEQLAELLRAVTREFGAQWEEQEIGR